MEPLTKSVRLQNIEVLQQAGVMALLRPLLLDNVPRCVTTGGASFNPKLMCIDVS